MADEAAVKRRGRPRKTESAAKMTAQLCVLMPPEMKEWALDNGGSEMVRTLIAKEQRHQEVLHQLLALHEHAKKPLCITWRRTFPPFLTDTLEGRVSWTASSDKEHPYYIFVGPADDPYKVTISVGDILRVQEPGDNGAILWEK